jgi:DNA invertase Pin-like site-specific DNA recombinase
MQIREVNSGAAKREARERLLEAARRRKLHRNGISKSEIASRLRIGRTSVRRILGRPISRRNRSW